MEKSNSVNSSGVEKPDTDEKPQSAEEPIIVSQETQDHQDQDPEAEIRLADISDTILLESLPEEQIKEIEVVLNDLGTTLGEEEIEHQKKLSKKKIETQEQNTDIQQQGDLTAVNNGSDGSPSSDLDLNAFGATEKLEASDKNLRGFFGQDLSTTGTLESTEISDQNTSGTAPSGTTPLRPILLESEEQPEPKFAPVALDDSAATNQDSGTGNIYAALLANDTDANAGDTLSIFAVDTTGTLGSVIFDSLTQSVVYSTGNAFDYLSAAATATDTFIYAVSDDHGTTDTATVTVTVTGINDPVTGNDDTAGTNQDSNTGNLYAALLANDTDIDTADTLSIISIDTIGTVGLVVFDSFTQSVVYSTGNAFDSLAAGATATDSFAYTVSDGNGATETATVTVTVTGVNDAPVATDDGLYGETVEGGSTVLITVADLLLNDTDADTGDTKTITSMSLDTGQGAIVNNGNGTWTYTPPADSLTFSGMATITYTLQDTLGLTDTATLNIRVFNQINGTARADTLTPADRNTPHKVSGLGGNDSITGSNTRDILDGGNGNDTLNAGDGDDDFLFSGSSGTDSVNGSNGYDRMLGSSGNDTIILSAVSGIDYIDLGTGTNIIQANNYATLDFSNLTAGVDLLNLSYFTDYDYNETIIGTMGDDVFQRQLGWYQDTFRGGNGNDTFLVNGFAPEYDTFDGGNGYDQILGTVGNDSLLVNIISIEFIDLGAGTNVIAAVLGTTLDLSALTNGINLLGVSYITDDVNAETLIGTSGADTLQISVDWFTDTLNGSDGDDTFTFSGNLLGNDNIIGGNGYDSLIGSAGNDTLAPMTMTGIEFIDLGAGTNSLQAYYGATLDLSSFTQSKDFLGVTFILDNIEGETIFGTDQDDIFVLTADSWVDTLYGNNGADTFMITATRSERDTLEDFDVFEGDIIDISQILSYNSALGDIISDFIQFIDSDKNPGDGSGTVTMRVDADGTGKGHDFSDYFVFTDQNIDMMGMIKNANLIVE